MNVHMEMWVGYTEKDTPKLLKEWIMSIVPQPYLQQKDLQAPDTAEIGLIFCANPLMQDKPVHKKLYSIMLHLTIAAREPPILFAILIQWINNGDFSPKRKKEDPSTATEPGPTC